MPRSLLLLSLPLFLAACPGGGTFTDFDANGDDDDGGPPIDASIDAGPDAFIPDADPGAPIISDNQNADLVLGQSSFEAELQDSGGISSKSLDFPNGIASDGAVLYVADGGNGRVLIWSPMPTTSFANAIRVVGKETFTDDAPPAGITADNIAGSSHRIRVAVSGSKVLVSDTLRHRVLLWDPAPTSMGQSADRVVGQTSLTASSSGTTQSKLNEPNGIWTDGTRLVIADTGNHRVMIWNTFPATNGQAADLVLGQPNFTTNTVLDPPTASSMRGPRGVYFDGTRLYVADTGNHRVLVWNTFPTSNGEAADFVLGQDAFTTRVAATSATGMRSPQGIIVVEDALFIADEQNDRVIVFTPLPSATGEAASLVLGQPNLDTGNNNPAPTQASLDNPEDFALAGDRLFVTDREHHRVLRFDLNL